MRFGDFDEGIQNLDEGFARPDIRSDEDRHRVEHFLCVGGHRW